MNNFSMVKTFISSLFKASSKLNSRRESLCCADYYPQQQQQQLLVTFFCFNSSSFDIMKLYIENGHLLQLLTNIRLSHTQRGCALLSSQLYCLFLCCRCKLAKLKLKSLNGKELQLNQTSSPSLCHTNRQRFL